MYKIIDLDKSIANTVLKVKKSEKVIIAANPETNLIAQDLYTEALAAGAEPTLIFQPAKKAMDAAEPAVIAAIKTEPQVFLVIAAQKMQR